MKQKAISGQALVEYALILILVAIVVIGVLALAGPAIGQAFSAVVDGLQTTPAPAAWTYCSDEYDFCSFSGTKEVRYGKSGHYNVRTLTNGTPCSNAVFGDPLIGTLKECSIR